MDFLFLALIYTVCFAVISYVLILGGSSFHRGGFVWRTRSIIMQVYFVFESACVKCLPAFVTRRVDQVVGYLFFSRNPCMQIFYGFLLSSGCAVYTLKVLPFFDKMNSFCMATYVLIAIDVMFFTICCKHDPGIITPDNIAVCYTFYAYDGLYYTSSKCRTCELEKPARSKHCSVCNVCISRFDHHCSWVNNCIGQRNYKYFLGFIGTTAVLCLYTTFIIVIVFAYITVSQHLMTMHYLDSDGKHYLVSVRHLCQYFLVHHTSLFTLFMVVLIFALFLTLFSFFHVYLLLTNQTTNEVYKRYRTRTADNHMVIRSVKGDNQKGLRNRHKKEQRVNHRGPHRGHYTRTPYYQGIWSNVVEVVLS